MKAKRAALKKAGIEAGLISTHLISRDLRDDVQQIGVNYLAI